MQAEEPTFTYDAELGEGYYVRIPSAFMRLPKEQYSTEAKVAYGVLLSYASSGAKAWPGMARLAEEVGCCERSLRDALHMLRDGGLISVRQRGQGRPNTYHVHKFDEDFKGAKTSRPAKYADQDRQNMPVKTGTKGGSRPAEYADELGISISNDSGSDNTPLTPKGERHANPRRGAVRSDKDAALRPFLAAFRRERYGGDAKDYSASEFKQFRSNLLSLVEDGRTPDQFAQATRAALRRWTNRDMVTVRSVAAKFDALLEPDPVPVSPSARVFNAAATLPPPRRGRESDAEARAAIDRDLDMLATGAAYSSPVGGFH